MFERNTTTRVYLSARVCMCSIYQNSYKKNNKKREKELYLNWTQLMVRFIYQNSRDISNGTENEKKTCNRKINLLRSAHLID